MFSEPLPDIDLLSLYAKEIREDEEEEFLAKDDRAEHLRVLVQGLSLLGEAYQHYRQTKEKQGETFYI